MSDLPWLAPEPDPTRPERRGRRCSRHDWTGEPPTCRRCGHPADPARLRRGRRNRARGNAIEREMARALGLRRVGQYGGAEDLSAEPWVAQVKSRSGRSFPAWMHDEIARLPATGAQTPLLIVAEAGISGRRRRALVVLRLEDWTTLHGPVEGEG